MSERDRAMREEFDKAGYWPNEVLWGAWQKAWTAALAWHRRTFDRIADIAEKSQERAIEAIQQNLQLEEDAARYRWLRNECSPEERIVIAEYADQPYLLDHHVDKGRCGL